MKVKLIVARTMNDTVFFNYGDDYSDITRVLVEDHSPFEEVDHQGLEDLKKFVEQYNLWARKDRNDHFMFLIESAHEISAQATIKAIRDKRGAEAKEYAAKQAKAKEIREKAAAAKKAEKELKTLAQKKKQLEKLKQELGEA